MKLQKIAMLFSSPFFQTDPLNQLNTLSYFSWRLFSLTVF